MSELDRMARQAASPGRPPLERWHPPLSGDIDIRIDRDGNWFHEGDPIQRPALVKLFASILRREDDGEYYLVTPVEKWRIRVEDAPLIAVDVDCDRDALRFTLNTGDEVVAGPDFPLQVEDDTEGAPRPYLSLRHGLRALVARAVFYRLVEMAELRDGQWLVRSGGAEFTLGADS